MDIKLNYIQNGEFLLPDLESIDQPSRSLTKYGMIRMKYLEEQRPLVYNELLMTGKLYAHCLEIEEQAMDQVDLITKQIAKKAGLSEELKNSAPLEWVGQMNTFKAQAEEIVLAEMICN